MPKIQIKLAGLFKKGKLDEYKKTMFRKIWQGCAEGLETSGKVVRDKVRAQVGSALKIKKKGVLKSFVSKVYKSNPNKFPTLEVYSGIFWMRQHEKGGTVSSKKGGKLFIPFLKNGERIGYKDFRNILDAVFKSKKFFFKNVGRSTILFAPKTAAKNFRKFTRQAKQDQGKSRIKKDEFIPIAVVVKSVNVPKRIKVQQAGVENIGTITKALKLSIGKKIKET